MSKIQSETDYPIIILASSSLPIPELLARISKVSAEIQIFDPQAICCKEHLLWSYINAKTNFKNKTNRAKTLSTEMLLCAAMTSQIGEAIKKAGAKSGKSFILFSNSKAAYPKIAKYLIDPVEFKPQKAINSRLISLGIKSGKIDDLIQEIALHAMNQ